MCHPRVRCTQDDTECDFGYELGWFNHTRVCKPMTGFNLGTCPHVRDHSYDISASGRRLVGGDMCAPAPWIMHNMRTLRTLRAMCEATLEAAG